MKFYIDGPKDSGEGPYFLLVETGEVINSHFCSSRSFARFDLHDRCRDHQAEWKQRFGEYEVLFIGDDDLSRDELMARNRAWVEADDAAAGQPAPADGEGGEP